MWPVCAPPFHTQDCPRLNLGSLGRFGKPRALAETPVGSPGASIWGAAGSQGRGWGGGGQAGCFVLWLSRPLTVQGDEISPRPC